MTRILEALKMDVENKNFYSALYVGLSLIDACARIEQDLQSKRVHYIDWLVAYFLPLFERDINNPSFPSSAIYQLRCSVLHESTNLIDPRNRKKYPEIANLYQIILTTTGSHRNRSTVTSGGVTIDEIQVDVVKFVEEIVESIEKWSKAKPEAATQLKFTIHTGEWSSASLGGASGFSSIDRMDS